MTKTKKIRSGISKLIFGTTLKCAADREGFETELAGIQRIEI